MGYVLRFGVFELNLFTEELHKFGTPIKLAPQPFKVLALLVSQAGRIVTREQIQLEVWGEDTFVDFEQGMNQCIKQIRNALSDSADTPRYVETLPRRGYRFIAPVEARKIPGETPEGRVTFLDPETAATYPATPSPEAVAPEPQAVPALPVPAESTLPPASADSPQSHGPGRPPTGRIVGVASLVVAILLGGFIVWRSRISSQQLTSSSGSTVHRRKSVAVLGFQNVSGRADAAWYSTAFSEMLRTELAAGDHLRMIEGETVDRMKTDLHLAETDSLAKDTLQRVRKMVGADYVLVGSYTELGTDSDSQIRLDMRVQDAGSGETVAAVAETGTVDGMFDLVSRAGARVRLTLGLPPVSTKEAGGVRAMLPSNADAARLYSQALAKLRVFDAMAARDLLRESVAAEPDFAPAHSALAAAWKMLGYERDAKEEAQKSYKLAGNLPREEQLSIEARYREMSSQWDQAIPLYQTLWHAFPDNVEYGLRLASAQKSSGKAKDALATVETLRALPAPSRDDPRIDLEEASAAFALGSMKQSQDAAARGAEKADLVGSTHILARAKTAQAKVLFAQGDLPAALNMFRQSRDIYQQVGDATGVTASLSNIASVLQEQGQLAEAQGMYDKALAIYLTTGDKSSAALTLNNMGVVFLRQRKFAEAKKAYGKSLDLYREVGDKFDQGFVLNNMGGVLYLEGDLAGARKMHESALAIDRESANRVATAEALSDLGQVLAAQGDLAGARQANEEALKIQTEMGDADSANNTRLAMAQLSLADGQWPEAETAARKLVMEISEQEQPDLEARSVTVLAQAMLGQGKAPEASAAIARGESYMDKIDDPAFQLSMKILASRIRGVSGDFNAQLQAIASLQQLLSEATKGGFVLQQMEAELALGEVEIASGKSDAGRTRLKLLQRQATSRGFLLIARQAADARAHLAAAK